jgi:TctA family transporter
VEPALLAHAGRAPVVQGTLRQGLLIADGSVLTFLSRPVTAIVLVLALLLLAYGIRGEWRSRRRSAGPVLSAEPLEEDRSVTGGR